ncbi:MAG: hypothetical protein ACRD12_01520 [Acidimicrobiales bacterium]
MTATTVPPVRRFGIIALLLAMSIAAAGCGGGGDDDIDSDGLDPGTTAAAATAPTTAPGTTVSGTSFTLRITSVQLINSEESDNGMRILLPAGVPSASVTLTGLPTPNRVINVCQARELDRRLEAASCRTPASGEALNVTLGAAASGVEIIQVGVAGAGAAGNQVTLDEVTVRYTAPSREVNIRLAQIASGEAGGRPTFGLTPGSANGAYNARLTWNIIPVFGGAPNNGQLELVQSGNVTNQAQSSGDVRLAGNVPTPVTDVVIRAQNLGGSAMVGPKLNLVLP